jgi:general secretion pathway protein G
LQVEQIEDLLKLYFKDNGCYPASGQALVELANDKMAGPYIAKINKDPWGRPFQYRYPGIHNPDSFDLWSIGKDGIEGTKDDIANFR